MVALLIILVILALLFGGLGFALHALFWVGGVLLVGAIVVAIIRAITRE
jgi:hypothetical protein